MNDADFWSYENSSCRWGKIRRLVEGVESDNVSRIYHGAHLSPLKQGTRSDMISYAFLILRILSLVLGPAKELNITGKGKASLARVGPETTMLNL